MKEEICVIETGGASITHCSPLFTNDSRYLICPCGNVIKVFSINTGECFQKLLGHSNAVTGVAHHPKIKLQILSSSLDGTIKVWDYEDGIALKSFSLNHPLHGIYAHSSYSNIIFVLKQGKRELFQLTEIDLKAAEMCSDNLHTIGIAFKVKDSSYVALSELYIAVAYPIYFTIYSNPSSVKAKNYVRHSLEESTPPITCIACHPKDEVCATGHENGVIRLWYKITDSKNVVCHVKHWHSVAVGALSYSANGSMLLSGGHECVLVQWQEDSQDFFPRLNSEITGISVSNDGILYATTHKDNSILVVTNFFVVKQSIEGFATSVSKLPCGFQYDEATGSCVTNGKPGHLLFYLCANDRQLYNLDIVGRNFISSADLMNPLSKTTVTNVAFNKTRKKEFYMATIEFDDVTERDQKLKFWNFDETNQSWTLQTVVVAPHNNKAVTSLCFHPHEPLCVTTSRDGTVKAWIKLEEGWCCEACGSYRNYEAHDSAFSQDGSVLALAFGHTVSLCDPLDLDNLSLFASLSTPVKSIFFGRDNSCHLVVIVSDCQLQCWNVISGTIVWCSNVANIRLVVQDNFSENLALFTCDKKIFIFRPSASSPMFSHTLNTNIISACFIPQPEDGISWSSNSSLYMLSENAIVSKFTLRSNAEAAASRVLRPEVEANMATPMSALLSIKIGKTEDQPIQGTVRHSTVENAINQIFNTPPHVLPAMSTLCDQFISSLLFESKKEETQEQNETVKAIEPSSNSDQIEKMDTTTADDIIDDVELKNNFDFLIPAFDKMFKA